MSCASEQDSNELYVSLPAGVRRDLMSYEEEVKFPSGAKLITHGVPSEHLIIIKEGSAQISVPIGERVVQVGVAGPGRVVGLRTIVAGTQPEFDVSTLEECTVAFIPGEKFIAVLKQHPEIYSAISRVLSRDLQTAEDSLRRLPRRSPAAKRGV